MQAAAICEPPIFSPTSFLPLPPRETDGSERRGRGGRRSFGFGAASGFGLDLDFDLGSAGSHCFGARFSDSSFL